MIKLIEVISKHYKDKRYLTKRMVNHICTISGFEKISRNIIEQKLSFYFKQFHIIFIFCG